MLYAHLKQICCLKKKTKRNWVFVLLQSIVCWENDPSVKCERASPQEGWKHTSGLTRDTNRCCAFKILPPPSVSPSLHRKQQQLPGSEAVLIVHLPNAPLPTALTLLLTTTTPPFIMSQLVQSVLVLAGFNAAGGWRRWGGTECWGESRSKSIFYGPATYPCLLPPTTTTWPTGGGGLAGENAGRAEEVISHWRPAFAETGVTIILLKIYCTSTIYVHHMFKVLKQKKTESRLLK